MTFAPSLALTGDRATCERDSSPWRLTREGDYKKFSAIELQGRESGYCVFLVAWLRGQSRSNQAVKVLLSECERTVAAQRSPSDFAVITWEHLPGMEEEFLLLALESRRCGPLSLSLEKFS